MNGLIHQHISSPPNPLPTTICQARQNGGLLAQLPSQDFVNKEPPYEHSAHFQATTVLLSVEQYQKLMKTLAGILEEAKSDKDGTSCSIVLLGFTGEWRKGHNNSMSYSSFVWEK